MASKPWFSVHRNQWVMKYKPVPGGDWATVALGRHSSTVNPDRVPKKPPMEVADRAREYVEIEYRALNGLGAAPQRARPLAGYIDAYLANYDAARDPASARQARRHAARFLAFCLARVPPVDTVQGVTKATCRDYLESRAREVSPATLQTEKGYLSGIWSRAVEDELMEVNPWSRVKVPGKKAEPRPTFWSGAQVAAIAAAARKPWARDLILILANTGIRISAALAMRWEWVDWSAADGQGTIRVPAEHDKAGVGYTQTMEDGAREVLERRHYGSKSGLVFPHWSREGPISYDTANDAIGRAIGRAGVPKGTPHDFRHSYGRALERAGTPLSIIQRQLGHKNVAMTERYTSASEDETSRWIGRTRLGLGVTPPAPPPGGAADAS